MHAKIVRGAKREGEWWQESAKACFSRRKSILDLNTLSRPCVPFMSTYVLGGEGALLPSGFPKVLRLTSKCGPRKESLEQNPRRGALMKQTNNMVPEGILEGIAKRVLEDLLLSRFDVDSFEIHYTI